MFIVEPSTVVDVYLSISSFIYIIFEMISYFSQWMHTKSPIFRSTFLAFVAHYIPYQLRPTYCIWKIIHVVAWWTSYINKWIQRSHLCGPLFLWIFLGVVMNMYYKYNAFQMNPYTQKFRNLNIFRHYQEGAHSDRQTTHIQPILIDSLTHLLSVSQCAFLWAQSIQQQKKTQKNSYSDEQNA